MQLFLIFIILAIIHTVQSYIHSSFAIRRGPSSCILIAFSISKRRTSTGGRTENQTLACLTASRRTTYWATPHPTDLRRTLLSNAALPSYAVHYLFTPHPTELRRTLTELLLALMSYAAPYWATPHPTELLRTLLIYATPYWDTPHPTELLRTLLSYAAPYWATPLATPHPSELDCK